MLLTDTLKSLAKEATKIRESLTLADPRAGNVDTTLVGRGERSVAARRGNPRWDALVAECADLFQGVYAGSRPSWHLQEAMSTSDFPLLFGDLLYRQMLGNYTPYPVSYPSYFRVLDVKDFRTLNLYTIDGGQAVMTKSLKQYEPYPEITFTEGRYQIQVAKYGRRYGINWEMVINDDLNAFAQRPLLMATGARRSEEYLATTMLAQSTGPHATFFSSGNNNLVTGNPALSIAGLQTAYQILAAQKDAEGEPIVINAAVLVVPPALQITAENIMNAVQLRLAEAGGTSNQLMYVNNWMKSKLRLAINPYLPIIDTTHGSTAWYLIADPTDMTSRPAFNFAFLRGYREPQLFVKDPDARLLGGGDVSAMEGSFDTDAIDYKLRHIFGAAQCDPKMAVTSHGNGS